MTTHSHSRRPNLLFVLTDQQRADSLGCYGNELVQTPNLDALAASGSVFENAYVAQPVCTPARASLLTGLYPHTHGSVSNNIPLAADVPTLAEHLPAEYRRAFMGKWHLGDELNAQHGFDEWVSSEDRYWKHHAGTDDEARSDYHHFLVSNGFEPDGAQRAGMFTRLNVARLPEQFTKARFLGGAAARFLNDVGSDPFALVVSFLEPHRPYAGPLDDLYPPEDVPVGPHFRKRPPENAARINQMLADHYAKVGEIDGDDLTTEAGARKTRAKYLGNATLVDRAVGDILRALDESGQRDNTIVVYTSEHGDMMGDHALFGKCVMYEEAVRVPLIIRAPQNGRRVDRISGRLSQVDIVPTLLDLLGAPPRRELQGVSRAADLTGDGTLDDNDVAIEWNGDDSVGHAFGVSGLHDRIRSVRGPWRTLVSADGWKLNLSSTDQCELYDMNTDPYEQVNLFDDPARARRIADMTTRLRDWQHRTGDESPLPDQDRAASVPPR